MNNLMIYGCDFSGAKNTENKIFVTVGELNNNSLNIKEIIYCEERLDLFEMITNTKSPWALDFPFSIPVQYLNHNFKGDWNNFIRAPLIRVTFATVFGRINSNQNNTKVFRKTDINVQGKSPISSTPIDMLNMLYGGRKLLSYLLNKSSIYPFTPYFSEGSRLYEVYPKHTWNSIGINNKNYTFQQVTSWFMKKKFQVTFSNSINNAQLTLDQSDSLIACITLGYCINKYSIESNWGIMPQFSKKQEWNNRSSEGLIIRV